LVIFIVPGSEERKIKSSLNVTADSIVYDLEDGVAFNRKGIARKMVVDALGASPASEKSEKAVRINAVGSESALAIMNIKQIATSDPRLDALIMLVRIDVTLYMKIEIADLLFYLLRNCKNAITEGNVASATDHNVERAARIVYGYEQHSKKGIGAFDLDGKMYYAEYNPGSSYYPSTPAGGQPSNINSQYYSTQCPVSPHSTPSLNRNDITDATATRAQARARNGSRKAKNNIKSGVREKISMLGDDWEEFLQNYFDQSCEGVDAKNSHLGANMNNHGQTSSEGRQDEWEEWLKCTMFKFITVVAGQDATIKFQQSASSFQSTFFARPTTATSDNGKR
ncbi:13715_t:CDS:2, partial [Racocetra fulgida]